MSNKDIFTIYYWQYNPDSEAVPVDIVFFFLFFLQLSLSKLQLLHLCKQNTNLEKLNIILVIWVFHCVKK